MVKYKKKLRICQITAGILAFCLLGLIFLLFFREVEEVPLAVFSGETSLEGFVKVEDVSAEIVGGEGIVTLRADCYALMGNVEPSQAISIVKGKKGEVGERPTSHDLIRDMFNLLGIKVLMVKITDIRDNLFFSKLIISQGKTLLNLDVRPSDGIAIALRTNAPIYVKKDILTQYGKKIC